MVYTVLVDDKLLYRSDFNDEAYMIVSPKLDEELNKTATFSFTILPTHVLYDQLHPLKSQVVIMNDTRVMFKGRVMGYETDLYGQRSVTCEDAMSYLLDSVFIPTGATKSKQASSSGGSSGSSADGLSSIEVAIRNNSIRDGVADYLGKLWNDTKTKVSDAVTTIQHGGTLSDVAMNWLTGYYNNQSSGGSSGGGSSTTEKKETMIEFLSRILISHNSQVEIFKQIWPGDVTIDGATKKRKYGSDSISDTRSVIDNALIQNYGGFLRLRYEGDTAILDYLSESNNSTKQEIQFGVNLEEINYSEDTDEIFSVLMPLGKDNGTIANSNNGSYFLENEEYIEKYGRIVRVKQWSDLTTGNEVKAEGQKYLDKHCSGVPVTMEVKAIDMHILSPDNVDEIKIGDNVRVIAPARGIDIVKMVTKISHDFQSPQNDSYTIGDFDSANDDSTAAYHNKDYSLTNLLAEVEKSGKIERDGLAFKIRGLFEVQADSIRLQATNVAPEWVPNVDYEAGQYVTHNGILYRFKEKVGKDDNVDFTELEQKGKLGYSNITEGLITLESTLEEHHTQALRVYATVTDLYGRSDGHTQAIVHIQDSLANEYSNDAGMAYQHGDYVLHDGEFYVCREYTTGGNWQASKWQRTNAGNGFVAVNGTIHAAEARLESLIASSIEAIKANIQWLSGKRIDCGSIGCVSADITGTVTSGGVTTGSLHADSIQAGAIYADSVLMLGSHRVATENWVDSTYLKSTAFTWNNLGNRPSLNIYTIADKTGTLFQVYGP